jgi:peptidyl-prolyl cis-trans isomerase C
VRPFGLALLASLALLLTACDRSPRAIAEVAGRKITLEELDDIVVAQTGQPLAEVPPELADALFGRHLEEEVLLAASGEPRDRTLPPAVRGARTREALAQLCPPPPLPSEQEIDAYLATLVPTPPSGDRLRLRQLILPDRASAEKARERLAKGEDFEALSREMSRAPNASEGGAIGWIERGQLPPEFEAAVFPLAAGQSSAPVASNAGWHVFQVIERQPATSAAVDSARQRARADLAGRAAEASRRQCLNDLAGRVGVRVDCDAAPFPCSDPFTE